MGLMAALWLAMQVVTATPPREVVLEATAPLLRVEAEECRGRPEPDGGSLLAVDCWLGGPSDEGWLVDLDRLSSAAHKLPHTPLAWGAVDGQRKLLLYAPMDRSRRGAPHRFRSWREYGYEAPTSESFVLERYDPTSSAVELKMVVEGLFVLALPNSDTFVALSLDALRVYDLKRGELVRALPLEGPTRPLKWIEATDDPRFVIVGEHQGRGAWRVDLATSVRWQAIDAPPVAPSALSYWRAKTGTAEAVGQSEVERAGTKVFVTKRGIYVVPPDGPTWPPIGRGVTTSRIAGAAALVYDGSGLVTFWENGRGVGRVATKADGARAHGVAFAADARTLAILDAHEGGARCRRFEPRGEIAPHVAARVGPFEDTDRALDARYESAVARFVMRQAVVTCDFTSGVIDQRAFGVDMDAAAFVADTHVVSAAATTLRSTDVTTGARLWELPWGCDRLTALGAAGARLVTRCDRHFAVRDVANGLVLGEWDEQEVRFRVAMDARGDLVIAQATSGLGYDTIVLRLRDGRVIERSPSRAGWPEALSPDGTRLLTHDGLQFRTYAL